MFIFATLLGMQGKELGPGHKESPVGSFEQQAVRTKISPVAFTQHNPHQIEEIPFLIMDGCSSGGFGPDYVTNYMKIAVNLS